MPERIRDELKMLPLTEEGMEKISSNNFYDVVEYIKQHDAGMMKKMNHVRNMGKCVVYYV